MLLPTKRIPEERSLLVVGGGILRLLNRPKTVSRLWEEIQKQTNEKNETQKVTYNWFILALDFLFIVNAIDIERGQICKLSKLNDTSHI
jgi:hypothetical protein